MFIRSPSAESVRHRHSGATRVACLHVTSRCEIWRLVAEKESTLRIVPVKHISHPNFRAPAFPRDARLEVRQESRRRTFIVGFVVIEVIEAIEVEARIEAVRPVVLHSEVELVLRRVRLL